MRFQKKMTIQEMFCEIFTEQMDTAIFTTILQNAK